MKTEFAVHYPRLFSCASAPCEGTYCNRVHGTESCVTARSHFYRVVLAYLPDVRGGKRTAVFKHYRVANNVYGVYAVHVHRTLCWIEYLYGSLLAF